MGWAHERTPTNKEVDVLIGGPDQDWFEAFSMCGGCGSDTCVCVANGGCKGDICLECPDRQAQGY